jgi:hypothetical protein
MEIFFFHYFHCVDEEQYNFAFYAGRGMTQLFFFREITGSILEPKAFYLG